jgi:hydroxymethylglutaryl-CoA reductase (NADPH)
MSKISEHTLIPTRRIGPIKIIFSEISSEPDQVEEITVPLATFEKPLWPSVSRGAQISRLTAGIKTKVLQDNMTRSILLESPSLELGAKVIAELPFFLPEVSALVQTTSNFCQLQDWHWQLVGNLLFLRFSFSTGEAAGHNMTTKTTEAILNWLLTKYPTLKYVSISGNYCTDKKISAVNGILGRGKYVVAEMQVSRRICQSILHTTPEQLVNINLKKNLIGSIIAGSLRSANAHFSNMLLAFFLATGQDVANIIEGSQGITHTEIDHDNLYFSVTLPNIIIGTIGSGKDNPEIQQRIKDLGCCQKPRENGQNARRLAMIAAATVLCGELSLLAALTVPGKLTKTHIKMERKGK